MSNPDFAGPYWQDQGGTPAARQDSRADDRSANPSRRAGSRRADATPQWQADAAPRRGQGQRGRRAAPRGGPQGGPRESGGAQASTGGYGGGGYSGSQGGAGGYGGNGDGYGGNGYGGQDPYGPDAHGQNPYGGDPYGGSGDYPTGGRTAAGVRERAIDRTGVRARLAERLDEDGFGAGPGYGGPGGDGPGGRPPKRKGSWWRRWTWRKALAVFAAGCALFIILIAAGITYLYLKTQVPTAVQEAALQQSSTVYFANGKTPVGEFTTGGKNRQLLQSSQIPDILKQAVIAAEDRQFYSEGGISPTGILRAAYQDATGGEFQGGSTITQQFVRNYYTTIGTGQTASRKVKEIFVAIKLSHTKSKDWILTNYLNTVYLGDNAYGVAAAAQTYFNRPALKLNVAQSAMLAAMINQPGYFNPDPHSGQPYTALVQRWHYVLVNMVRDGTITQAKADSMKFPKIKHGHQVSGWTGWRGYIMQAVLTELTSRYGYTKEQVDTEGLRITTTFSEPMMKALYQTVAQEKQAMTAGGHPLPGYARIGAVLQNPNTGSIVAMYGGPSYSLNPKACDRVDCEFNMATQAREQVGSSFKPYVLATAVKQGMNVGTSVLNGYSPLWIPPDTMPTVPSSLTKPADSSGWYPLATAGEDYGPITVAKAAALSSNGAFGDLIHRVGTAKVRDMAAALGVDVATNASDLDGEIGQAGMALGQGSLTVGEQANTYATFVNGGMAITPHVISSLSRNGIPVGLKIVRDQVLTQNEAGQVDYALSFDTKYGTATNAAMPDGRPIIGKTGTTNTAQSAFFIGAIPQYSLAIGIFTKNQSDRTTETLNGLGGLSQGGYGGTWPALIWHAFSEREFAQLPIAQLPPYVPEGQKWIQVTKVAHKKKHHKPPTDPNPSPIPHPTSSCPVPGSPLCSSPPPSLGPSPNPTPTQPTPMPSSPNPSPGCSFGFCSPSAPVGGGGGGGGGGFGGNGQTAVRPAPAPSPRPTPVPG